MYQAPVPGFFTGEADDLTSELSPSYFALIQPDFRTNGFDWLDFDMPDFDFSFDQQHEQQPRIISQVTPAPATQTIPFTLEAGQPTFGQSLDLKRDSTPVPAQGTITPRPAASSQAAQTWPFDQTKDASSHQYTLPPLKEVLQNAHLSSQSPPDHRRDSLVQLLSEQRLPTSGHLQGVGAIDALGDIQRLLDIYFSRFHDIQAIIHKPTWNMDTCPTVLLTAMACVGALLSEDERDADLCSMLSDMCLPMIIWLVSVYVEGEVWFTCLWLLLTWLRYYE
jgi:hypothetical protein